MKVRLKIETHAYAEEQLCDEVLNPELLDDIDSCGILEPEVILPLRRNHYCKLDFDYERNTKLREVVQFVLDKIGSIDEYLEVAFLYGEERYWIEDSTIEFQQVVDKYLDPLNTGEVKVAIFVSMDAGTVCEEGQLRYFFNSHEAGRHNKPHVHVSDTSHEASISLFDGEVLAGELPKKLLKKARKKISEEQKYFVDCWNTLTDGLRVDVNHHFGYINY